MYVWCDQRDCQYVDLNQRPCPLNTAMFDDGSERRVAMHLQAHAGARLCYGCLTSELQITHDQVRRAVWRLKDHPGISIASARCAACRHRGITIELARGAEIALEVRGAESSPEPSPPTVDPPPTGTERLKAYLRRQPGFRFCAHCLARAVGTQAASMRKTMSALGGRPMFSLLNAQCGSCLLTTPVIRFDEGASGEHGSRRVIGVLAQLDGEPLCLACVARATHLSLAETRPIVERFRAVPGFEHAEAPCSACGRLQNVVRIRRTETSRTSAA